MKDSENHLELEKKFVEFYENVIGGKFVLMDYVGICVNFDTYRTHPVLNELIQQWGKYSGRVAYPICVYGYDPQFLYYNAANERTMWDKSTEYGRLRWELFEFIYNKCKERLSNQ